MKEVLSETDQEKSGPKLEDLKLENIMYALSDRSRLKILQMIVEAGGELRCGSFVEKIGLSKPTLSHHFNILRENGVIATRTEGTLKLNTIREQELNRQFPGLLAVVLKSFKTK